MAIPKFLEDLLIISKLGDNPGVDNGLSSSGLREKFDEAGVKIQEYINDTLIPAISGLSNPEEGLNMKNNIAMGGHRVTGLGDPVADGDAVPRGYANSHFAPSGYGLGDWGNYISLEELNTPQGNGRFVVSSSEWTSNPFPETIWGMVDIAGIGSQYATETVYNFYSGDVHVMRRIFNNNTQAWELEWENPPMIFGEEYRTTERWNGSPVYVQAVDLGPLPNNKENIVPFDGVAAFVVGLQGFGTTSGSFFDLTKLNEVIGFHATRTDIRITTNYNLSTWTGYAIVKYTK